MAASPNKTAPAAAVVFRTATIALRTAALILCAGVTFSFGVEPVFAAEAPTQKQSDVVYEAASQDIDYRNNTTMLHDVVITQGGLKVQAKEARVEGGVDFANNRWSLRDDVRITTDGGSLRSDRADVTFENDRVSRATIVGSPASFEQLLENGKDTVRGRAGVIEYDFGAGIVKLTDQVWFSNGKELPEVRSDLVIYNVRDQRVQINPGGQSPNGVRGVIRPGERTNPRAPASPGQTPPAEGTIPKITPGENGA
jgi:lipopolysaccharide transport protein LptA